MKIGKGSWFRLALQLRGSVIPAVLPKVLLCTIFGLLISLLHQLGLPVSWPILGTVIPSIVLGLLLVFRTNTAYERFWEGRKAWGELVNTIRNLARQIWVFVQEETPSDRHHKEATLYLLVAYAIAIKLHLRQETPSDEFAGLITPGQLAQLQKVQSPPLRIVLWIEDYLQKQSQLGRIYVYQLTALNTILGRMVDALGVCERISKTPIPVAYAIHLKQLLLIYCLLLPFQLVADLGFWTGAITGLISFTLFGIEEIGIEIENPFGYDLNDLPLDAICKTIRINIDDLMETRPQSPLLSTTELSIRERGT
jgi:ion channel-forming bestrophin family protein